MASSADEEWVYVVHEDEDGNAATVEASPGSAAAGVAAAVGDGVLPGGASDDDVGYDYDATSYDAAYPDDSFLDDIALGVASLLKIDADAAVDVEATPRILLHDGDLTPINTDAAAEEAPASPPYDGEVPELPYAPSAMHRYAYGAYYGGQYIYAATYYPSYYLPPTPPHVYNLYGYGPYTPEPPPQD